MKIWLKNEEFFKKILKNVDFFQKYENKYTSCNFKLFSSGFKINMLIE